jgi:hypothetical protein
MGSRPRDRSGSSVGFALIVWIGALIVLGWIGGCMEPPWSVDLEGPRVVRASVRGPRAIEVAVREKIVVELSEALDPATVRAGRVVLVPWEEVGSCAWTPSCARGSCERGRCMTDPLTEGDLKAIDRGEFAPVEALELALRGPMLWIQPRRALRPYWRYSLVIGAGVHDLGGAPLSDDEGAQGRWRVDLVTAHEGSSGPEARLVEPAPGELAPTNIAAVVTRFARPIALGSLAGSSLSLEGEDGGSIALTEPSPCPGWAPGMCVRWRLAEELSPGTRYRIGGGDLVDRWGRAAAPPGASEWFMSGEGADLEAPAMETIWAAQRGQCLQVGASSEETVTLRAAIAGESAVEVTGAGALVGALRLPLSAGEGEAIEVAVSLEDRAGNRVMTSLVRVIEGSAAELPPLAIAEVLANPLGAEPAQEFVEVLDLRREGSLVALEGLLLADLPWEEVAARLAEGSKVGDAIPAFLSGPGQRTVIVGAGYSFGDLKDPDPPADAVVIRLATSIGDAGLRAAGEPLSLFQAAPPRLLASFSPTLDTSDLGGQSVVLADAGGCDHPGAWRVHPLGSSSPGAAP